MELSAIVSTIPRLQQAPHHEARVGYFQLLELKHGGLKLRKNREKNDTSGFNCVYLTPFTNSVYSNRMPAAFRSAIFSYWSTQTRCYGCPR